MSEHTFECANIPVAVAANALRVDAQTVRLLLQSGTVNWGCAFKRGKSKQFSYIIYPKRFYEETGYIYSPDRSYPNETK